MKWPFGKRRREAEWQEEIESHLAMREEWNREHGAGPAEAHNAARRQFGSPLRATEEVRAVHLSPWIEGLVQDVRYAARGFRKSPGFALVALATIAAGVGASAAVFSVVDPILFRPLPYPHDEQLVSIGYFGPVDNNEFNVVSSYLEWRQRQTAFQSMTSMRPSSRCDLIQGGAPEQLTCYSVEANFLRTLGVRPAAGRDFTAEDDRFGAPRVVLLSYGIWQRRFGGNPGIAGQTVTIDDAPVRVAGVLPRDFEMPQLGDVDLMMPEQLNVSLPRAANSSSFLRTFARLRPGMSIDQARTEMQPLFEQSLHADVPKELQSEVHLVVQSLRDRQIHEVKAASWMLMGAVLGLLLLACANVANLLLARAAARRRELAMRAAIGAGRGRLIRQMMAESLLLGLGGGAAGCGVAWALVRVFVALAPDGMLRLDQARIDLRVLAFALAAAFAAALLFGLAPALERPNLEWLAGGRATAARTFFRKALVAAQVAISLMLLTGASLLARSLWNLESKPLWFRPERVVTATFTLRRERYRTPGAPAAFFADVESRLRQLPAADFALSDSVPPRGAMGRPYSNIRVAGHSAGAANGGMVLFRWVTPGYFHAMGIPIVAGRAFREDERASGESPLILSATLAHRLFGDENPIGQHLALDGDDHWCPVVGVAADATNNGIEGRPDPEYYRLRMAHSAQLGRTVVAIFRSPLSEGALARWIRGQVAAVDPSLPVEIGSLEQSIARYGDRPRFVAMLVALFAGSGLLLAAVGLYGVLSFLVTQQTREIGVRMAIGARPRDIALSVERHAAIWTGAGAAVGIAGSLLLARAVRSLLFEVSPQDPVALTVAVLVLAGVAAAAAWIPARRAARVDPAVALRSE